MQHTPAWMSHSSGVPNLPAATPTAVVRPGLTVKPQSTDVGDTVTEYWRDRRVPQIGGRETGKPVKLSQKVDKREALK